MSHSAAKKIFGSGLVLFALTLGASEVRAQAEESREAPAEWKVHFEESLFAVVTHKKGVASGLAHEHLVVAAAPNITLRYDVANPSTAIATFDIAIADLIVDDPALNDRWQSELLERGLLEKAFSELSEKDRRKIRRSMLGPKQLNSEEYPVLRATVDHLRIEGAEATARLVMEVRGQTFEQELNFDAPLPAADGSLRIAATTSFRFTDFGIKPYSALLGAIKVSDAFDALIRIVATPTEAGGD